MSGITEEMQREIDAAFAAASGAEKSHGECVSDCKWSYERCLDAGGHDCRSNLEDCINGCPNGLVGGKEALDALLVQLADIEARHR